MPFPIDRVAVFCGSKSGVKASYRHAAEALGRLLASQKRTLVYGGGNVGLMGILADATLAAGGQVIGVIPRSLAREEVAHAGLTELRVVESMHERKAQMGDLADAFIAMPGGYGTFEELFEIITWVQLGLIAKPVGLLNVDGYYDGLIALVDHAVQQGFIRQEQRSLALVASEPAELLERLERHSLRQGESVVGSGTSKMKSPALPLQGSAAVPK